MTDKANDELALQRVIRDYFGVDFDIGQVIVFQAPVSQTSEATLFLTSKKQLYLYISGQSKLQLGDIQKIISRMSLKAELCIPPKGRPHYFEEIGRKKFYEVFPGRKHNSDEDIIFYRTLAPYNPALILISEVKGGHVYRFDSDAATNWRIAAKFTYRRIKTS